MSNNDNLQLLKEYRRYLGIKLETVVMETGISIGYLSRIEGGYVNSIKNKVKRESLLEYLKELRIQYKNKLINANF